MMTTPLWIWLAPAFTALFLYGLGQSLIKKYADDVEPALFCAVFVLTKGLVNLGYFLSTDPGNWTSPEAIPFLAEGLVAYLLDGTAWVLYFESVVSGPITIVGTLSAAYPALTVLFARIFLGEALTPLQYGGVALVLLCCTALSYAPTPTEETGTSPSSKKSRRWVPMSAAALILWGAAQTLVKHSYGLPMAHEGILALLNSVGGIFSLGVYAVWRLVIHRHLWAHFGATLTRATIPMLMMAVGDLAVLYASKNGPISIVAPLTGAYPAVTLVTASFLLREPIRWHQWILVSLIVLGMVMVS